MSIYNAFLMPYDSKSKPFNDIDSKYFSIGEAVAEWKNSAEPYERVQGILVDVKHLISNVVRPNNNEIAKLSETILESLQKKQES